jgi:predicted  nucleic acid-binding Zn-ribbon protein
LELQKEDAEIDSLESRRSDLDGQLLSLDREREASVKALEQTRAAADEEDRKRRELLLKVQAHKELHERNLGALEMVKKAKEATAAMSQIDLVRRALAQEESEVQTMTARIRELEHTAQLQEKELANTDERQQSAREQIEGARREIDEELRAAREKRDESAQRVSRGVLTKYERIRGRSGSSALYPLRGLACGRCNTAIPLQRRNVIAAGRSIEVCEGCGVLLYAAP